MTPLEEFRALVAKCGSIADLSRRSGLSRRAIEYKRDGDRPVRMWDVWAMREAVRLARSGAAGKNAGS